jgi:hypothetical protein
MRLNEIGIRQIAPPIIMIAIAAAVWFLMRIGGSSSSAPDTIDYQGQQVKLSNSYSSYEDYKDDPNNIAPGEIERVQQLVESAPVHRQYPDRAQLIKAMFDLKFPGYGLSTGGGPQPDGSMLELYGVEIPKSGQTRYLLFRGDGVSYTLIDDFVQPDSPMIGGVSISGSKLVYSTMQGAKVVERSPTVK